jgi:hypothetical protein
MTRRAQRDEIFIRVVSLLAAKREMVYLKICSCSTVLAAPSVALEHSAPKLTVSFRLKP